MDKIQDEIIGEFSVFDDWLDKYDYLIELSDALPPIDAPHRPLPHQRLSVAGLDRRTARRGQGLLYGRQRCHHHQGHHRAAHPRTQRPHAAGDSRNRPLLHRRDRVEGEPLAHTVERAAGHAQPDAALRAGVRKGVGNEALSLGRRPVFRSSPINTAKQ